MLQPTAASECAADEDAFQFKRSAIRPPRYRPTQLQLYKMRNFLALPNDCQDILRRTRLRKPPTLKWGVVLVIDRCNLRALLKVGRETAIAEFKVVTPPGLDVQTPAIMHFRKGTNKLTRGHYKTCPNNIREGKLVVLDRRAYNQDHVVWLVEPSCMADSPGPPSWRARYTGRRCA